MSGIVGHYNVAAGVEINTDAYTGNRALKVALSQGRYTDAVLRGRCFVGQTAASGVAPGTSVGTTAAFSLFNPLASGYYLNVLGAWMGLVSGTLGAGFISWVGNVNPAAAVTTGTAITATNCLLSGGYNPAGKPLTTATLPASPTLLRPFCSLNQEVIATTANQSEQIYEDVGGAFIIAPGCTLSLEGTTAAGSSPLVVFGIMWEEIPVNVQ